MPHNLVTAFIASTLKSFVQFSAIYLVNVIALGIFAELSFVRPLFIESFSSSISHTHTRWHTQWVCLRIYNVDP